MIAASSIIAGKRSGVSNWLRQFNTFIDLDKRVFKVQESLLGIFKWGSYEPLPKIDYVLVFKQLFAKCEACSIDDYENYDYAFYQVSIVYNKTRRIIIHETQNKDEAFTIAQSVAKGLNARLKDSATDRRKSTWLI